MDGCALDGRQVSVSLQRNDLRDKFLFNLDIYFILACRLFNRNLYLKLVLLLLYNLIFFKFREKEFDLRKIEFPISN